MRPVAIGLVALLTGCTTPTLKTEDFAAPATAEYTPQLQATVESGIKSLVANPATARFGKVEAAKSQDGGVFVCGYVSHDGSPASMRQQLFVAYVEPGGQLEMASVADNENAAASQLKTCQFNQLML